MTPEQWKITGLLLLIPCVALAIFVTVAYWFYEVKIIFNKKVLKINFGQKIRESIFQPVLASRLF